MSSWKMPAALATWIDGLSGMLDRRIRDLFTLVFGGLLLTRERRRTCTSWFRAAGITDEFRSGYRAIDAAGRGAATLSRAVLYDVANSPAAAGGRIKLGLDDTPSPRYGPKVEGAGLHHNPTPGPTDQTFLYGHVFVTLAWLANHLKWGTIALPLRSELYVREKDLPIASDPKRVFRTKLDQAVELIVWAAKSLGHLGLDIWLGVDGGYAKRQVIEAAKENDVTLVGRLRKDAALRSVPGPQPSGKRGRKPIYGKEVVSLAKRAGHKQGWVQEEMVLYGEKAAKTYKTFLATWRPAGGVIRVVLVKETDGWFAFFCTDPNATPAEILGMVADRNSLEQTFKDVKETGGAGQQQVRNLHTSIGAWHLNLWAYTLTELWAWDKPKEELVDRSRSPWDCESRRPSHADRRNALRRQMLREQIQALLSEPDAEQKLEALAEHLAALAV